MANTLTYNIQFRADTQSLQGQIAAIRKDLDKAFELRISGNLHGDLNAAVRSSQILERSLEKATTVNGTSLIAFNTELRKSGTSMEAMISAFAGAEMRDATNTLINTFATANRDSIVLSKHIQEIGRVLLQSFKFSAAQQFIRFAQGALNDGLRWAEDMNKSLTNISIVTERVGSDLDAVFTNILNGAQKLGIAAREYADAALIFYQQGLPDDEVQRRTDITIQAAKAAGQSVTEMSEQLTAVWNTYQMQGDRLQNAASIGAKLGADTAVDFKYIAEAMQIAASAGAQLGVSYEQLAAMIATVGSTTLQSASVIGNAYKTIFARLTNLKTTGEDAGESLGRITQALADLGYNILDSGGEMKAVGDIIQDLGNSWDTYSVKQQTAIAQTVGGVRQFTQFLSLMNNFEEYEENFQIAQAEEGSETLEAQYNIWADSIEATAARAKESWAAAFAEMFQQESIRGFYNLVEATGTAFGGIMKGVGGLPGILVLAAGILNKQIVSSLQTSGIVIQQILTNLTAAQRQENARVEANRQIEIIEQQIAAATAKGRDAQVEELKIVKNKLTAAYQTSDVTVRLQELQQKGNTQQQITASSQLQMLNTTRQRYFAAMDVANTANLELVAFKNINGIKGTIAKLTADEIVKEKKVSIEVANRTIALRDEAKLRYQMAQMAQEGYQNASDDANLVSKQNPTGNIKEYTAALTGLATSAFSAFYAFSSLSSMISGEIPANLGSIIGLTMQFGTAIASLKPIITMTMDAWAAGNTKVLATMGLVGVAIAALSLIVMTLVNAYKSMEANSPEGQLRRTKEVAAALGEELDKTQEKVKSLEDTWNNYDAIVVKLDNLAKGTEEWNNALNEVNTTVLDILSKNPELAKIQGMVEETNEGLRINAEKFADYQAEAATQVAAAQASLLFAEANIGRAQDKVNSSNMVNEINNISPLANRANFGETIAKAAEDFTEVFNKEAINFESSSENLRDEIGKELSKTISYWNSLSETQQTDLIDTIIKYEDSLNQLAVSTQETANQMKIATNLIADQQMPNATEEVQRLAMTDFDETVAKYTNQIITHQSNWTDGSSFNPAHAVDLMNEWVKLHADENYTAFQDQWANVVQNSDADRRMAYMENGETKTQTLQKIAAEVAYARAIEDLAAKTQIATERLDELGTSTENTDFIIRDVIAGRDLTGLSQDEYETQRSAIFGDTDNSANYINQLTTKLAPQLEADGREATPDQLAVYLGFANAAKMQEAIDKLFALDWDNINIKSSFTKGIGDVSYQVASNFQTAFTEIKWGTLGMVAAKDFGKAFNEGVLNDLPADKISEVLSATSTLDWSSPDIENNLITALNSIGVEIDTTTVKWDTFIEEIKRIGDVSRVTELTEMASNIREISTLISETEKGDIIDDEDYEKLIKYNSELATYFTTTGNGYKLLNNIPHDVLNIEQQIADTKKYREAMDLYNESRLGVGEEFVDYAQWTVQGEEYLKRIGTSTKTIMSNISDIMRSDIDGKFSKFIRGVGYSIEEIDNIIISGDPAAGQKFASIIASYIEEAEISEENLTMFQELAANMAPSISALKVLLDNNIITIEQYNAALQFLLPTLESAAFTFASMSGSNFSGSFEQQTQQLLDFNAVLLQLGLPQLTTEFLLLSTAEKDQELNIMRLEQAYSNLDAAMNATENVAFETRQAHEGLATAMAAVYDLNPDNLKDYAAHIQEVADGTNDFSEELQDNQKLALQVAAAALRAERAYEDLGGSIEDLVKYFKEAKKAGNEWMRESSEYADNIKVLRKGMSDLFGVNEDLVSENFIADPKNLDLLQKAIQGSEEALDTLGQEYSMSVVASLEIPEEEKATFNQLLMDLANVEGVEIGVPVNIDDTAFIETLNEMLRQGIITEEQINAALGGIGYEPEWATEEVVMDTEVPEPVTKTVGEWVEKETPQEYLVQEPDGNVYVDSLPTKRYSYQETTELVPNSEVIPGKGTVFAFAGDGSKPEIDGNTTVKQLSSAVRKKSGVGNVTHSTSRPSGAGKGGGGGGGAKKVTASRKNFGERYRDTNSALAEVTRQLDRVSAAEDKAYGASKLRLILAKNNLIQEQAQFYQQLRAETEAYLNGGDIGSVEAGRRPIEFGENYIIADSDKGGLEQMLTQFGISTLPEYDTDGFVTNGEVIINEINRIADAFLMAHATFVDGKWSFGEGEAADAMKAAYDNLLAEGDTIGEQLTLVNDGAQQIQDTLATEVENLHTWLSNKLALVDIKLQLKLDINAFELRQLEFLLQQLGDRRWSDRMDNLNEQAGEYLENAKNIIDAGNRLLEIEHNLNPENDQHQEWFRGMFSDEVWNEYLKTGHLTQEMIDTLVEKMELAQDTIEAFYDVSAQQFSLFHDALETILGDFDNIIDRFDSAASMIESWGEIWRVAGQPWADQRKAVDLLNKSISTQSSMVTGLQQKYELMYSRVADAEEIYNTTKELYKDDPMGTAIIDEAYQNWQQLITDTDAAKADMMSGIADMMGMIEEAAAAAAQVIVSEFSQGLGALFADVESAMDMYSQKSEIDNYYVNPESAGFDIAEMLRNAEKEMEGIDDPALLAEYAKWQDYLNSNIEKRIVMTEHLGEMVEEEVWVTKDGVELQETDLKIMQAEFELIKAKAAFEDARNAKNTMRLARDASGNWNYQYSSDETEDAEQNTEQAINNIREMYRQAADEASEMWLQLYIESHEYARSVDWQRYEQDEEYRNEVNNRMAWYEQQMDQHKTTIIEYNSAIGRKFEDTTLSVILDMNDMAEANEFYKQNTRDMAEALKQNHDDYQAKVDETLEKVGIDYQQLSSIVDSETNKIIINNQANEDSIRELRTNSDVELDAMMEKVRQWAETWKSEIAGVIADLRRMQEEIQQVQNNYAERTPNLLNENYNILNDLWAKQQSEDGLNAREADILRQLEDANDNRTMGGNETYYNSPEWAELVKEFAQYLGYSMNTESNRYEKNRVIRRRATTFDTGGLATGPMHAKLAQDGKKELVLNAQDTENMLAAIEITRAGIAAYLGQLGSVQTGMLNRNQSAEQSVIQPQVIIKADFPNVSVRDEIEAAFANLVNQAAQYTLKPRM